MCFKKVSIKLMVLMMTLPVYDKVAYLNFTLTFVLCNSELDYLKCMVYSRRKNTPLLPRPHNDFCISQMVLDAYVRTSEWNHLYY